MAIDLTTQPPYGETDLALINVGVIPDDGTGDNYRVSYQKTNIAILLLAMHLLNTANPHGVTAAQIGAYTIGQTDTAIANAVTAASTGLVQNISLDGSGNLILTFKDNSTQNVGNLVGPQGLGILSAAVNGAGNLVVTRSDGSTLTAGNVIGPQGIQGVAGRGVSLAINGSQHLIATYTDGTTADLGAVTPPTAGVTSFNGRTGAVTPQGGDYTAAQVTSAAVVGSTSAPATGQFAYWTNGTTLQGWTGAQATAALVTFIADTGSAGGTKGLVPASNAGDGAAGKFLAATGAWAVPPAGNPSWGQAAPPALPGQSFFGTGRYQVFGSNGTFTVPLGVTTFRVRVHGAGGSGGANNGYVTGGGGGGLAIKTFTGITPGTAYNVVVGVGGAPVVSAPDYNSSNPPLARSAGNAGGTSSFGGTVSATGGAGGSITSGSAAGGVGSGGDANYTGGAGSTAANGYATGGGSGASIFGNGGPSPASSSSYPSGGGCALVLSPVAGLTTGVGAAGYQADVFGNLNPTATTFSSIPYGFIRFATDVLYGAGGQLGNPGASPSVQAGNGGPGAGGGACSGNANAGNGGVLGGGGGAYMPGQANNIYAGNGGTGGGGGGGISTTASGNYYYGYSGTGGNGLVIVEW